MRLESAREAAVQPCPSALSRLVRRPRCVGALLVGVACFGTVSRVEAQEDHRLTWSSRWRRVGVPEYVAIGGFVSGYLVAQQLISPAEAALWTLPLPMDEDLREALVAESRSGRRLTGVLSDSLALLSLAQPLLIDSLIVTAAFDNNPDVAWQMQVISVEAYAFSLFLNGTAKRLFARERPYGVMCAVDPNYTDCADRDRFRSFYSGHSAMTATSAGLVCAHHTHLPLYGGGIADTAACGAAVAGTLATGILRIASDKHWASDVFVGHALGFLSGYLLPSLLYYRSFRATPREEHAPATAAPLSPPPQLTFSGVF